jgi:hypothetical protein
MTRTRTRTAAVQLTRTSLTRALVNLAARGGRPRCSDPDTHRYWTSEAQAERDLAASWCTGCPVLDHCAATATTAGERFGVWGGIDRTPAKPTP